MSPSESSGTEAGAHPPAARAGAGRIESVDLLRGVVIVIMALDHTRDYFTSLTFQPEDLARSFPALFFTRWITHFCAPAFFLLAGTGAFFYAAKPRPGSSLSRFLWTRGLWLVVLELTVIDFGFTFSGQFQLGIVIWALGWSMIVLAALVRLRPALVAAFAGALIVFHNAFDGVRPGQNPVAAWALGFLHAPIVRVLPDGRMIGILYPLVPWVGVMAAGYLLGHVYRQEAGPRRRILVWTGAALSLAFVLLRATNWYGDPSPWTPEASFVMTVCSFLNCTKYPPSLCFLLMTLGPSLVFLGLADGRAPRLARPILAFGRVPLCFFVAHIYLLHLLAIGVALALGQPVAWLMSGAVMASRPAGYGHGLPFVYAAWAAGVLMLYPLCRWYADFKRRSSSRWLSYF